jgi:rhodanese-related sulfurtransferase
MSRTITPHDLHALMQSHPAVTVLDVRRKADYDQDSERVPAPCGATPKQRWSSELARDTELVMCAAAP